MSQSTQILTVCQINLPADVKESKNKYVFKHSKNDTTKDINILDKNDNEFEKLSIGPKFKYYQNHEFHKLKQNLTKPRTVSIFHTNISSFNTNHENLEILLTNLDWLPIIPRKNCDKHEKWLRLFCQRGPKILTWSGLKDWVRYICASLFLNSKRKHWSN